jgi:hypothetical protein
MPVEKKYNVVNGTSYDVRTPPEVIRILENCRIGGTRVVLDYGDTETGQSWGEENDITGTISRSTGQNRIPIMIHSARSMGGPGLLDYCIVAIIHSVIGKQLYRHPDYKPAFDWAHASTSFEPADKERPYKISAPDVANGGVMTHVASFKTLGAGERYLEKRKKFAFHPYTPPVAEAAPVVEEAVAPTL